MRKGEMLGLQWDDIDLDAGTLYIQRTLCSTTEYSIDGTTINSKLVFNSPKTSDSERFLQVQPDALVGLRMIKHSQEMTRNELGQGWNSLNLVFCEEDGRPINPSSQLSRFKRFLRKHGVRPISIHDMRHSFAEILISDQASLQQVQQALGHRDYETTKNQYARDIPILAQQATAHISKILFPETELVPLVGLPILKKNPNKKSQKAGGRRSYG
jgi:integrase